MKKEYNLTANGIQAMHFVDADQFSAMMIDQNSSNPKYKIHAYSGGYLRVEQFPHERVVVDLSTATLEAAELPNYLRHKKDQQVGSGQAVIHATHIEISGHLDRDNAHRSEIVASHKSGKKWQASIGAARFSIERVPDGESRKVNNRVFVGPFVLASGATITEVSFVDRGGDIDNHVSLAAQKQELNMNPELKAFIEVAGFDPALVAKSETQLRVLTAAWEDSKSDPEPAPAPAPAPAAVEPAPAPAPVADALQASREQIAADTERCASIRTICATYGNPTVKVENVDVNLEAHAIREGWDVKKVELEARLFDLDQKSGQASPAGSPYIAAASSEPENLQETLEASLAMNQMGVSAETLEADYSAEAISRAHDRQYRNLTLRSLLACALEANGRHSSARMSNVDLWAAAYDLVASGTSTLSLPNLLENVMNKSLLSAFELADSTWSQIASVHNANDFKPLSFVRLTAEGGYRRVHSDGEIKHMGITDSKQTAQAETFGCILAIDRKMIINDDLSGLQQRAAFIGQAAATRVEEEFYQIVLGMVGSGFTSVANKNLLTGAGSALDAAGVKAARENFQNRTNANKKPIMARPSVLLHGTTLETEADSLYVDGFFGVGDTTGASGDKVQVRNPFRGLYMPVCSPYVNNTDITDSEGAALPAQSDTKWFLFVTGNAAISAVRAVFLNGVQSPRVETQQMSFERLGAQTRSYHDFGFAEGDTEGVLECAGA